MDSVRIFIVDDNKVIRQAMNTLLEQEGFIVCGQAEAYAQAIQKIMTLRPALVFVDISLGGNEGGIELIKFIHEKAPEIKTLAVSLHEEAIYADRALAAGARGYLMKQDVVEKISNAIQCVLQGSIYTSERYQKLKQKNKLNKSDPVFN